MQFVMGAATLIVSLAFGFASQYFGLEKILKAVVPRELSDQAVVLALVGFMFLVTQSYLGTSVGVARKKFGVDYPIMYPERVDVSAPKFPFYFCAPNIAKKIA